MKLMSLNCPNCGGPVKQTEDGRFYCENCGTTFVADYDPEDVEFQRLKAEEEKLADRNKKARERSKTKVIVIVAVAVAFTILVGLSVFVSLRMQMEVARSNRAAQQQREAERAKKKQQEEESKKAEEESRKAEEEAARQELLASYRVTPEDLTKDAFFVENANAAMAGQLEKNTNLYYTNWVWNEQPEYVTSYLLIAKDENDRVHNILANIYKVHWDKVYDDHTEHYVMYDGACLRNVSLNKDGTIKSDYEPHSLTYNSEIIANQFLSGYTDFDQLIRQEIYGNADYDYTEFAMPVS